MGAEIQASEVRPGEKTWGDCVETAWVVGLQSGATATEGVRRGSLGCLGGPAPLFGGCLRGGAGPAIVAFSPACVIDPHDSPPSDYRVFISVKRGMEQRLRAFFRLSLEN